MKISLKTFIGLLLISLGQCQDVANPCQGARDVEPIANLTQCLDHIRDVAFDADRFFFGSDYEEKCTGSSAVDCFNVLRSYDNSIASIAFGNNANLDDIDRFLYVVFNPSPITYEGCGTTVSEPESYFSLDMSLEEHRPVTLREAPVLIRYDVESDDEFFTLVVLDIGFGFLHAVVTNIPGNRVDRGDFVKEYSGPLNFRYTPNPYVFFLFKQQNENVQINENWQNILDAGSFFFQLPAFMDEFNLMGPVAMNVMVVTTDIYAIEGINIVQPNIVQNCAAVIGKGLEAQGLPFLEDVNLDLGVVLEVTFTSRDLRFEYCCEEQFYPGRNATTDPIGSRRLNSTDVRDGSNVTFNVTVNDIYPNFDYFEDSHYMMVALDVDVSGMVAMESDHYYIHYFAANLEAAQMGGMESIEGQLRGGQVLMPWQAPMPVDRQPHRYMFFMAKQTGEFDGDVREMIAMYVDGDCENRRNTSCFDVLDFIADNSDAMVGSSWFLARNDDYVNYVFGRDEADVCGRRYPCDPPPTPPVQGEGALQVSVMTMLMMSVVALLRM